MIGCRCETRAQFSIYANLTRARSFPFSASTSRSRAGAWVCSDAGSLRAAAETSSTSNAAACRHQGRGPLSRFSTSRGTTMTAFNAVRFKVKSGREQEFLDAHRQVHADWPGLRHVNIIKTGDRTYCIIAEWDGMDALANARPHMIKTLDSFRGTLEDLGGGLGVTDPVAGPVVLALK
jgi:hypothetical protein